MVYLNLTFLYSPLSSESEINLTRRVWCESTYAYVCYRMMRRGRSAVAATCRSLRVTTASVSAEKLKPFDAGIIFFLILAHSVYKMWIIQEPNKLALWNKLHFEEKKTESIEHV